MAKSRAIVLLALALALTACVREEPQAEQKVVTEMPKSAKRGVAFSFTQMTDLPLLSPYVSWDYNWGPAPTSEAAMWFDANEMDFCPMCWNGNYNADKIRQFVAAHPKTRYLLAFNEPNLTDQANMTPAQAAQLWPQVVALAKELNLKLVSPAMNYGTLAGYSDPIKWLDEFFAQPGVSIDDVAAISVHCYMSSPNAVKNYIEKFRKYEKPVWLTEFCAWDPVPGSVTTQMDYMCSVLNYLEQEPLVERYAWFIPRAAGKVDSAPYMQLLTHDSPAALTDLGKMYCYFSPMDSTCYLTANRPIYAGEYTRVKNYAMTLRPTNDDELKDRIGRDGLMITNFAEGQELTFQLALADDVQQITLRYCGYTNAICEVLVDGVSQNYVNMPRNGSSTEWTEAGVSLPIRKGNHRVTLSLVSGSCLLSGFVIE